MKNVLSIIMIVASLAVFAFFVSPQYQELKEVELKGEQYEEVLANAKKLQELRDQLLEKRRGFRKSDLNRLEKLIPDNVNNVKLILELQNIASKYGLSIEAASSEKSDGKDGKGKKKTKKVNFDIETKDYGTMTLNFTIHGMYPQFIPFLKDVEDNLRLIDVRTINLTPADRNGNYQFDVTLETYWLKDNI